MKICLSICCIIFSLFHSKNLLAENINNIANNPAWLSLGHYQKTGHNYKSYIDDQEFFLAEDGKVDPAEELAVTLEKFKTDPKIICRYPARYAFLRNHFDLPVADCPEFSEWFTNISATGITLIFPSSYVNNPASAFGHTLIRLDHESGESLPSYAVNFSAETHGEPGLVYAFKGIFGGYQGYFKVQPYYELVKKYSALEKRDIWEYELNYTQAEIDQLVRHLWELRQTNFDYYYFDANCSFQLLGLFDVLRPSGSLNSGDLRSRFNSWAIPSDTLRELLKDESLLKETEFRPSLATSFKSFHSKLKSPSDLALKANAKEIVASRSLDKFNESALSLSQQQVVLDLAYDYLEYLVIANKIPSEESDPLGLALLQRRSQIDILSPPKEVTPQANPLDTHPSRRLSFKLGSIDDNSYLDLDFRGVYHDLLDPPEGFLKGSAIDFISLGFRKEEGQDIKFNSYKLVDIFSLSPEDYFVKPLSWRLFSGANREEIGENVQKLIYRNELYLGKAYDFNPARSEGLTYVLAGPVNILSGNLTANHSTGLGLNFGAVLYTSTSGNLMFDTKFNRYWWGEQFTAIKSGIAHNYSLDSEMAIRTEYSWNKALGSTYNQFILGLNYYF